jgi:uncharacterized protein (TIGR03435 family)
MKQATHNLNLNMPTTTFQSTTARNTLLALLLALGLIAHTTHAESQTPSSQPAFEVASIRPVENHPLEDLMRGIGVFSVTPWGSNRFIARNATLSVLIQLAYGIDGYRLSGKPAWLESQLYDVSAKAEGDTTLTKEQMLPLLRQLLEQRFHLVTHTEKKEAPGYILVEAKGGAKLKASNDHGEPHFQVWGQGLTGHNGTVMTLATILETPTGRPVIDKTGIQGAYDFDLRYSSVAESDPDLPSVFTALQEQLGLKLESQKVPIEALVIDHVDKVPTEN